MYPFAGVILVTGRFTGYYIGVAGLIRVGGNRILKFVAGWKNRGGTAAPLGLNVINANGETDICSHCLRQSGRNALRSLWEQSSLLLALRAERCSRSRTCPNCFPIWDRPVPFCRSIVQYRTDGTRKGNDLGKERRNICRGSQKGDPLYWMSSISVKFPSFSQLVTCELTSHEVCGSDF